MAKSKKTELTLDATGLNLGNYCPTDLQRLTEGTPTDVRNVLKTLAFILDPPDQRDWHVWLHDAERKWLAAALARIGYGEDPRTVLRLKSKRKSYRTLDEVGEIQYQIDHLREQGASKETALALVASHRLGFDRDGRKPVQPTPTECNAEVERLKKMLGKKKKAIFP